MSTLWLSVRSYAIEFASNYGIPFFRKYPQLIPYFSKSTSAAISLYAMVAGNSPVVIVPIGAHNATCIFFHGLGEQANKWVPVVTTEFGLKNTKFILPNAALRPVSIAKGFPIPAWFDIHGVTIDHPEDEAGIKAATRYAHSLIDAEVKKGTPSEKIIVGGCSMGGALSLYAGLTYHKPLGGIVCLSGFLMQRNTLPGVHKANLNTPIFLAHGTYDYVVPYQYGKMTADAVKSFNKNVSFNSYSMGHTSCPSEMKDLRKFLEKRIENA